mmetsp:Transcript_927/g.1642  ORF Transcript_927/g.1642 Transcript_927/m.1642 type:complete len:212 (+) Transcript_927:134-769(+)
MGCFRYGRDRACLQTWMLSIVLKGVRGCCFATWGELCDSRRLDFLGGGAGEVGEGAVAGVGGDSGDGDEELEGLDEVEVEPEEHVDEHQASQGRHEHHREHGLGSCRWEAAHVGAEGREREDQEGKAGDDEGGEEQGDVVRRALLGDAEDVRDVGQRRGRRQARAGMAKQLVAEDPIDGGRPQSDADGAHVPTHRVLDGGVGDDEEEVEVA